MPRKLSGLRLLLLVVSAAGSAAGQAQSASEAVKTPPASVTIPDGTPVELRFAQAVWGVGSGWHARSFHAHPGDVVRLVVAADVLVEGQIVIHRGSPAQVTVTKVSQPERIHGVPQFCICMLLRLDWAKSVGGEIVSLRPRTKGKATPFRIYVYLTSTGSVVQPLFFGHGMRVVLHQKDWIPPGSRLIAFVHGDAPLDAAQIREAQGHFPIPNETGLVMVYRTKGHSDAHPLVLCDGRPVGRVGSRQFVTLEMEPGEHSCRVEQADMLNFSVLGGREYYLYLQYKTLAGNWKLSLVSNGEGEDGVGAGEPVNIAPAKSN